MMKIKIVCRRFGPGLASTNRLLAYAKGFVECGCEVTFIYLITNNRDAKLSFGSDIKAINLWEADGIFARKYKLISYIKNLFSIKSVINPGDVVFMYGDQVPIQLACVRLKNKSKIFCEITEHPFHDDRKISTRLNTILSNILLRRFNGLFVISNNLKDYYESVGIDNSRITIINMFVDAERFQFQSKRMQSTPYIAYCGKISICKDGVNDLISAFSIFNSKIRGYKLKIIGSFYNSSDEEKLRELVYRLKLENSVEFTGPVPPSEMPELLNNATILALDRPNSLQAQNGFPTKLGEYLATGNPVVVTKVGEITNFLRHKINAFLAEPGNNEDFADQLEYIVNNQELAKKVGQEGRKLVFKEFSYLTQSKVAIMTFQNAK